MNLNQTLSLIRAALLSLGTTDLVNKGLLTDSDLEKAISGILIVVALIWSFVHHGNAADAPASSTPPTTTRPTLMLLAAGLAASLFWTGCASTPQQASYRAVGTTIVSVDTAMNLWGAYVAAKHPSPIQETAVKAAYEKYQASMTVVCDAGAAYSATGGTNATAVAAFNTAVANAGQELTDLENLMTSFGVTLQ
jgi:hypothetical protein